MRPAKKYLCHGKMRSIGEAALRYKISKQTLWKRMTNKGMTLEEAVDAGAPAQGEPLHRYQGQEATLAECCAMAGGIVEPKTARDRMRKGWDLVRAVETPVERRVLYGIDPERRAMEAEETQLKAGIAQPGQIARIACEWLMGKDTAKAFGFRCVKPDCEFAFGGDLLEYRVIVNGGWADITALYRRTGMRSSFRRSLCIEGGEVKKHFVYVRGRLTEAQI